MTSQNSIFGKILRVNLTNNKITKEETEPYAKRFLGGRGINQWILFREVKPWMSPFDPANRLIFGTGTLVGTPTPGACRFTVDSKNVFTNGIGSANAGGHFSSELKFAGYDHVIFQGRARRPVYLWIDDESVEIRDASSLWGCTTWETEEAIKEELGDEDIQIASIGPAGENLVRNACIIAGRSRAAGRCGLGAVMGSKNLKSVAVRGTRSIEVANPEAFMKAVNDYFEKIEKCEGLKMLKELGTYAFVSFVNEKSMLPSRNFQDDYTDPAELRKILPEVFLEFEERRLACFSCPTYCSHFYEIKRGPYAGTACEGFEADLAWDCTRMGIFYAPAVIKFQALCSEYGLDIDGVSCPIAWAFECYEKGIITDEDTDGLKLNWGDYEVVLELIRKIAYREGFGDILAEGCKRASEIIGRGSERYAIHVKGQDLVEPLRSCKGWALAVVVSARGGTHTRGAPETELIETPKEIGERLWGVPTAGDPSAYTGKPKVVVYYERMHAILDSLGVCIILSDWVAPGELPGPDEYARLFSTATGWEMGGNDILVIGERIHNLEKAFNIFHARFDRRNDYPPPRFVEEPIKSGPFKGERIEKDKWDRMLDEYYELHGWDKKTSWPFKKTLQKLKLGDVVDVLEKRVAIQLDANLPV